MSTRTIEGWLVALQGAQVAFLLLHDLVPMGRLSNLAAVRGIDSTRRLVITTVLSALPWMAGLALCLADWPAWPHWLVSYLTVLYWIGLAGACMAWWIPYLIKPDPERAARYKVRFAGTIRVLPERNGISPDLLHVIFHATLVATVVLLWLL